MARVVEWITELWGVKRTWRIAEEIGGISGNENSLENSTNNAHKKHPHTQHTNLSSILHTHMQKKLWTNLHKFGTKFKSKHKTQKSNRPANRGSFLLSTQSTSPSIASHLLSELQPSLRFALRTAQRQAWEVPNQHYLYVVNVSITEPGAQDRLGALGRQVIFGEFQIR